MATFTYKAIDASGRAISGDLECLTPHAALDELRTKGLVPVHVKPKTGWGLGLSTNWLPQMEHGFPAKRLAQFALSLHMLIRARIPVDKAMAILAEQEDHAATRTLMHDAVNKIEGGATLHQALAESSTPLPHEFLSAVQAGEHAGRLDDTLGYLAKHLRRNQEIKEKIRSALIYPAILLIMAALAVTIVITVVVPELEPFFTARPGPMPTGPMVLIATSNFLSNYGWSLPLAALAFALGLRTYGRSDAGRENLDLLSLSAPWLGTFVAANAVANFSRTLAMQLNSKVPILEALTITQTQARNTIISKAIRDTAKDVERGERLSAAMAKRKAFPRRAVALIEVGERGGSLESMLEQVADIYGHDVTTALSRFLVILTPAITLLLGGLVAGILITVFSAILDVNTLIG